MIAFLAMIPAFALGWAVVRLLMTHSSRMLTDRSVLLQHPARGFYAWMLEICLGIGVGAGISSLLDFLLTWAGFANRASLLAIELLMLAGAGFFALRRSPAGSGEAAKNPSWIWMLRIAAMLAAVVLVLDFSTTTASNPAGEWDAAGIWNLRARYLAGGRETWRNAVSNETPHPGYPLLVSGFIAGTWTILDDTQAPAPAALSLTFTLATAGVLCGALAPVSESLGLLALLVLLAGNTFGSYAAWQYADIPLSFFVLGCVATLTLAASRDWPPGLLALAGLLAGFAAWTKNEGLPFAIAALLVVLWRGKLAAKWMIAGAAGPILATLALKLCLVHGRETIFPNSAVQAAKLVADPSRWTKIIASFASNIWSLGVPWAHPILLLAILAFAFGFVPRERWQLWLFAAPLALLAADFGIYLITMADLDWHLNTSNSRLILQVWPAVLFAYFLLLRAPAGAEPAKAPSKTTKKRARV